MTMEVIDFKKLEKWSLSEVDLHRMRAFSRVRIAYDTPSGPTQALLIPLNTPNAVQEVARRGLDTNNYDMAMMRTPTDDPFPVIVTRWLEKSKKWQTCPLTTGHGEAQPQPMNAIRALIIERARAQLPLKLLALPQDSQIELTTEKGLIIATLLDPPITTHISVRHSDTRVLRIKNENYSLTRIVIGRPLPSRSGRPVEVLEYRLLQ